MKFVLVCLAILASFPVSADPACTALKSVVGAYQLLSRDCHGAGGDVFLTLNVRDENGAISLWTGNIGITPSTSADGQDKCTVENGKITVQTCAFSKTCLPQNWFYVFSGDQAVFSANHCVSTFRKVQ